MAVSYSDSPVYAFGAERRLTEGALVIGENRLQRRLSTKAIARLRNLAAMALGGTVWQPLRIRLGSGDIRTASAR